MNNLAHAASYLLQHSARAALRDVALAAPSITHDVLDHEVDLPADHPAQARAAAAGDGAAFVCRRGVCSLPIRDPQALTAALPEADRHG